jgi:Zn-dependent M28 family amino/carboxypeptidase
MIGSPNFVRFVYDGDGSAFGTSGPSGSATVEGVFNDYFASQGLQTEPTEFDGRSDYEAFINAGIPAGGLFSGAEDIKTAQEAAIYGGTAGVAYDECYHQACDDISNLNKTSLDQLADAAAHATLAFAQTTSAVSGTDKASNTAKGEMDYKGPHAKK